MTNGGNFSVNWLLPFFSVACSRSAMRGAGFDLDGTLVDSVPDLRAALNKMLGEMGRGELTADEVRRTPT